MIIIAELYLPCCCGDKVTGVELGQALGVVGTGVRNYYISGQLCVCVRVVYTLTQRETQHLENSGKLDPYSKSC